MGRPTTTHTRALRLVTLIFAFALYCVTSPALALKPEHEAQRLVLATQQALEQKNYVAARQYIDAAKALKVELPNDFHYFEAQQLLHDGLSDAARQALENYVDLAGREGEYYRKSLRTITEIAQQKPAAGKKAADPSAKLEWSQRKNKTSAYTRNLQSVYQIDNGTKALVAHINSMLSYYAYNTHNITAGSDIGQATRHRIRSNADGEIISSNLPPKMASEFERTEERFSVFGVNPYVNFRCASYSCWLLNPVDQSEWLQIENNEKVATELSKAMRELIRTLQKHG